MKIKWVLTFILAANSFGLFAQESSSNKLIFNGLSLGVGPFSFSSGISSVATFQKLAPQSELLKMDLKEFNNSYYYNEVKSNTITGGYAHFNIVGKNRSEALFSQSFRIGITYADQSTYYDSYNRIETFTIDTVTSNTTGIQYPIDSTASQSLSMNYNQSQLYIDAAYLLQTGECNRFSLFGGLGAAVGLTIDAFTTVYLSDNFSYSANTPQLFQPQDEDYNYKEEVFKNKVGVAFIASIPLGVDFRIGQNRSFWKNSHLCLEFRPSLYVNQIPELETELTTAVISMFSYRFQFR